MNMEDVGDGGFDTERIIPHVTWLPKQQAHRTQLLPSYVQVRHKSALACSTNRGILMRTESG